MNDPSSSAASDQLSRGGPPAAWGNSRRRELYSPPAQPWKRHKPDHGSPDDGLDAESGSSTKPHETPTLSHEDYDVAWICALHTEMRAARAVLDTEHQTLPKSRKDTNNYVLGSIQQHNVVIACLPTNQYGIVNAASVATNLNRTFPAIHVALMVGVGGGAPSSQIDLRLGDVVVGVRVMQSDLGKFLGNNFFQEFQRTAFPRFPPMELGTLVTKMRSKHDSDSSRFHGIIQDIMRQSPDLTRPRLDDCLFQATYDHDTLRPACDKCDRAKEVPRSTRKTDKPTVHYGAISSGSQLMRNAHHRDQVARELDVVCFEMEAAGLMDILPCLVIRGISDYSDSHKNKDWQLYAAAAAASYARELLEESRVATTGALVAPRQKPQDSTRQRLLGVLMFDKIKAREKNIKTEHTQTCTWFSEHPDYKMWLNKAQLSRHHGFLWIRGKPGAGKSTIMKYAFASLKKKTSRNRVIASFFFNARGEHLERSVTGMYRSILYQLLQRCQDLPLELDDVELMDLEKACPPLDELKEIFRSSVLSLGKYSLTCFIDALDESDEQQIIEMVQYFENLTATTAQRGIEFRVCFSSRHYPYINIRKGKRLVLEDMPQHQKDLDNYVRDRLEIDDPALAEDMRLKILDKAAGVFLWVELVVNILNKEYGRGGMALQTRFQELPSDLSELFRKVLERDQENMDELLLCVLWILYAKNPLSPQEYDHALWSGLHTEGLVDSVLPDSVTRLQNGSIGRYIISSSKGLAEVTKSDTPTVQFIHESVRDFLIKDHGLSSLWPGQGFESPDHKGLSHEKLKVCCRAYLEHYLAQKSGETESPNETSTETDAHCGAYLFLEHAVQNILYHADAAAVAVPQEDFLSGFPLSHWIQTNNFFETVKARYYRSATDLTYVLADRGYSELIRARHTSYDTGLGLKTKERFRYPIFAALANGNTSSVAALLGLVTNIWEGSDVTRGLIEKSGIRRFERIPFTPLGWAASEGFVNIVRLLIERGAPVDEKDATGSTPLLHGVKHKSVVKALVEAGADVTSKDAKSDGTVLHVAASFRDEATVKILVNNGAELSVRDFKGQTPLFHAVKTGSVSVARFLVEAGEEVKVRDSDGDTPLHIATRRYVYESGKFPSCEVTPTDAQDREGTRSILAIIKLLLSKGADMYAQNDVGSTSLHDATLRSCGLGLVELLIQEGAYVDARDSRRRTPLHISGIHGVKNITDLLIRESAEIDAQDSDGNTPLHLVARFGTVAVVDCLLQAGAEINARNNKGYTPLFLAVAAGGPTDIVKSLLQAGAEINARDSEGRTPLHQAFF